MPPPLFSIVVCSIDDKKFSAVTENYRRLFVDMPIEIIGVHDARSLSEGYNRGIAQARGQNLILSHDDISILTPDFATRLRAHLNTFDLVGVAGTTRLVGGAWFLAGHPYDYQLVTSPHPKTGQLVVVIRGGGAIVIPKIEALDGLFLAMRTKVARQIGFDQRVFDHFHLYDLDFTYRAHLAGFRLAVCRDLFIIHNSHGSFDKTWSDYRARFERKFADRMAPELAKSDSLIGNFFVDPKELTNPDSVARLCHPDTIATMLAAVDQMPKPS